MASIDGGTVTLLGEATLTPPAATLLVQSLSASLMGEASVAANMTGVFGVFATMVGDASISADPFTARFATATLVGDTALTIAAGEPNFRLPAVDLVGESTLTATAEMAYAADAALAGEAAVAPAASLASAGVTALGGEATVPVSETVLFLAGAADLTGEATVTAAALDDDEGAADLVGGAAVAANMNVAYDDEVTLVGGAAIVALAIVHPPLEPKRPLPTAVTPDPFAGLQVDREPHRREESFSIDTAARSQIIDIDETDADPRRAAKVPRDLDDPRKDPEKKR